MTYAFQLRVAAVCDRLSREISALADDARNAGLSATATTANTISDVLARLAFDAAKEGVPLAVSRVSKEAGDCSRAMRQVAKDLHHAGPALERAAEAAAMELSKLCRDSFSQTQPLE